MPRYHCGPQPGEGRRREAKDGEALQLRLVKQHFVVHPRSHPGSPASTDPADHFRPRRRLKPDATRCQLTSCRPQHTAHPASGRTRTLVSVLGAVFGLALAKSWANATR